MLAVLDEGIQVRRRFPCDQVSMRTSMKQDESAREDCLYLPAAKTRTFEKRMVKYGW